MDIQNFEKLLTPEMKNIFTDLSTKFANANVQTDDPDAAEPGSLGGMFAAASKIMAEDPELIKNSIEKMGSAFGMEGLNGMENLNMPGMIQQAMKTFGIGGSGGGEEKSEAQKKIDQKKYIEKHITIAVTSEELEKERVKRFRIKVKEGDKEKQIFELKLEKDVYAYQFWDKTIDGEEDILIRVGVEEIVKDILD